LVIPDESTLQYHVDLPRTGDVFGGELGPSAFDGCTHFTERQPDRALYRGCGSGTAQHVFSHKNSQTTARVNQYIDTGDRMSVRLSTTSGWTTAAIQSTTGHGCSTDCCSIRPKSGSSSASSSSAGTCFSPTFSASSIESSNCAIRPVSRSIA